MPPKHECFRSSPVPVRPDLSKAHSQFEGRGGHSTPQMVARRHFDCPIFHPTLKDVSGSFEAYVERLEKRCAGVGVCKIVAPKGGKDLVVSAF